ncbi:PREDICTED: L-threonine dehydratase catabolic TdcB-like isoform X2 [Rhagoletis zephyria]|uniref:L-threonine dehydratase catabolic TdcB-like isoform X2 n=1 Tax=Rhagoletis zephyria TaxID=28612 RepID=UPI0008119730|nr:PREDICTED: L-threonine dehydratase catabolic TdcB-like isoform X2 [Rhagoletis zephyria]
MDDDIIDVNCNPKKPRDINLEHITTADLLLKGEVVKTPCTRAANSPAYNMDLYFKKEFMQVTGSFKERGARFALLLLSDRQKEIGVVSASTGNHALAISYHGNQLNIPVTVVMPTCTSRWKIEKCRSYKATVIIEGRDIAESRIVALVLAKERQLEYINGYDHPHVIAGCGTIGFEVLNQVPKIDAIVVPIGGGGLIAGMALTVKMASPNTKIIGVELEKCPSFTRALENKSPIYTAPNSSVAEGLLVPTMGCNAFPMAYTLIDKLVVVRESWITLAMLRLVEEEGCIVEGAAAVGLAAILAGQLNELQMKRVVVLLTGCNTDVVSFGRALERGLFAERRLLQADSDESERQGGLLGLLEKLSKHGLAVNDLLSETVWLKLAYKMEVDRRNMPSHNLLSLAVLTKKLEDSSLKTTNQQIMPNESKENPKTESLDEPKKGVQKALEKRAEEEKPKRLSEQSPQRTRYGILEKARQEPPSVYKHKKLSMLKRVASSKKHPV